MTTTMFEEMATEVTILHYAYERHTDDYTMHIVGRISM